MKTFLKIKPSGGHSEGVLNDYKWTSAVDKIMKFCIFIMGIPNYCHLGYVSSEGKIE